MATKTEDATFSVWWDVRTIVWDHHGEGSEESLEIVWQLSPASIAGVHGDKHRACLVQLDLTTLKQKSLGLRRAMLNMYMTLLDECVMLEISRLCSIASISSRPHTALVTHNMKIHAFQMCYK